MEFLLGLFLFSVLLTTGVSLECEICKGLFNCTSTKKLCPEQLEACYSSLVETSKSRDLFMSKGCGNPDLCDIGVITLTDGNGSHLRQATTCCDVYDCDPDEPILPERNTRANGRICPGCSSEKGNCSGEVTACFGSETYCISYITLTDDDVAVGSRKGCTREGICTKLKRFDGTLFNDVYRIGNVKCAPTTSAFSTFASSPPPPPLSFPLPFKFLLLTFLLIKLIL